MENSVLDSPWSGDFSTVLLNSVEISVPYSPWRLLSFLLRRRRQGDGVVFYSLFAWAPERSERIEGRDTGISSSYLLRLLLRTKKEKRPSLLSASLALCS